MPRPNLATLADLCAQPGARFSFSCKPCRVALAQSAEQVLARFSAELLFEHYKARVVCPICKMPVDDEWRRLEFSCTSGDPRNGWSGWTPEMVK